MFEKIKSFLFKNTTTKQTVAKNTVWLTISNFGGRLFKAIIIIYAARVLGTADYGVLSYALTLAGFLVLFVDPGLNAIMMRDASPREPQKSATIFSTIFFMKLVLLAFGILIVIFVAPFFSILPGAKALLPIVALVILFDNSREFLSSFVRSIEKMEWEAAAFILANIAIVIFGFIALWFSPTALALGWAYAIGTGVGLLAITYLLRRHLKSMVSNFSLKLVSPILSSAWPFAVTSILGVLLTSTDILIVSWMGTASDVGIYSASIRIIQILYLISTVVQFSTLPLFSRLAHKDNIGFRKTLERVVGIIFVISVPLAIGGAILGTQIMNFVFGAAYASGGLSFKILVITMLVDYPAMIISNAIFAYNHQKSLIISSTIAGVANVILDLLFIPRWGIAGSAAATLIAQVLTNWYLWRTMKKINYFEVIPKLSKVAAAGIGMGAAVLALFTLHANVLLNIAVGGGVYVILLILLREPLLIEAKRILKGGSSEAIA